GDINKDEESSTINSAPQLPIQPVLLGVIIVSILAAGTCGYIGFDIIYGKRRMARKAESERVEKILEDDDSSF
ncbi:MAG: hypothetical protein IJ295_02335, partial [Clostridia bacterium]|nr:hypothetical protein [Clostridia bacterium]